MGGKKEIGRNNRSGINIDSSQAWPNDSHVLPCFADDLIYVQCLYPGTCLESFRRRQVEARHRK